MRVLDPGHTYALRHLDGDGEEILTFVKREGPGYPGNAGHYAGTNIQEVLRALIDRVEYLDRQAAHFSNRFVLAGLRQSLAWLEYRAAIRHGRPIPNLHAYVERMPVCQRCGHIECGGVCGHG